MKILLIEDEPDLAQSIAGFLTREGYSVDWANCFKEAVQQIDTTSYDCFLVDVSLPDGSGLQIISMLKKEHVDSGIIIITARNSLNDRIEGLDLGPMIICRNPFTLPNSIQGSKPC